MTDLELAERAARLAGELLLDGYGDEASGVASKSSATDMVSDADRAAEAAILALLRAERPDDEVVGEEGASSSGRSGRRWLVDPLDGTTNYLYRFPAWSVSVAVDDAAGGVAGVVFDPLRDELFRAARGRGAELGADRLGVSDVQRLDRALIATGFGYAAELRAAQAEALGVVLPSVRDIRRSGSAALDLAWVAAGRVDGYFERGLRPWDWAAGRLLVEEAGGRVAALGGATPGLAAAGPDLLDDLVELVG